ncbi:hypothetical protein KOW79_011061 [Hemibagrus wyckioides]|uniref:Legumain n=1 Tax=Hemibagrus wyckioides TaxID=337641 RepID=A0A9D3NMC3_9TELE|nr:hypothetical protein KOW79_011061 [Hemibagrus wyckioides]
MENTNGKQWVLLAAGSKDWENYRHQADVCHAYQVVRENGIPDDQIVVMMYDDIAYNEDGPNDSIFIYLSDHGSHGIFHFPNSTLYAPDLIDTVKEMSRKDKFSQMVIYMEACHAGSMLEELPRLGNVYAVAASNPDQSSYACFYDKKRNAYLADAFTAYWLHHTKKIDLRETTLQDQFNYIKENVTKWEKNQTPCNYGNRSMLQTPLSEFLGWSPDYEFKDYEFKSRNFDLTSVVESTNVPLLIQQNRIRKEQNHRRKQSLKRQYNELQRKRNKMNEAMQEISKCCARDGALRETLEVTRLYELKVVAEHFRTTVFNWDEEAFVFTLSHQQVLVNLCECGLEVESITAAIDRVRQRIQF